jgi:hypothetical protein
VQLLANLRREGGVFDQLAQQAKNTKPVFKRWAGFIKAKAIARIKGGGLAPIAESTQKHNEHTRTAAVTVQGNIRKSYARQLDRRLRRTYDARKELKRLLAGGNTGAGYSVVEGDNKRKKRLAVERIRKQLHKARETGERVGGHATKAGKHTLLGKAVTAWEVVLTKVSAIVRNALPFSEVLRKGGRVGNGAILPERDYLHFDSGDVAELAKIALEHLMGRGK